MKVKKIVKDKELYNGQVIKVVTYKCAKCGKAINSKYFNYCPYCGEKLEFGEEK